jgi:pimeloyl-ACP methyl ester carboxylesterase
MGEAMTGSPAGPVVDGPDVRDLYDLSGVTTRRVEVADGVELAVSEAGVGGRPLMLVHGFTGSRDDWSPVIGPLVDAGRHTIAADNRGHGDSGRPGDEASYTFAQLADDCFAVADAIGWDRFTLLGHSLGGAVVQLMVTSRPERIDAVVLMDTSHRGLAIPTDLLAGSLAIVRAGGTAALFEAMHSKDTSGNPLPDQPAYDEACARLPGYRELGARNLLRTAAPAYAALISEIAARGDHLDELAAITCPTLVIVGEQDQPFLGTCRAIADAIPAATLEVIAGSAHSPQFENTDAWLAAVLPFLASH